MDRSCVSFNSLFTLRSSHSTTTTLSVSSFAKRRISVINSSRALRSDLANPEALPVREAGASSLFAIPTWPSSACTRCASSRSQD
eukprot:885764-Rhodomonas_salina.1